MRQLLMRQFTCAAIGTIISTIISISMLNLTGCSHGNSNTKKYSDIQGSMPASIPLDSEVEKQLLNSAKAIEVSLSTLALTQQSSATQPLLNTAPLVTPEGGMGGTADIDWIGPIEPLIRKIADMSNYKVKVLGNEPAIPVIVSITQKQAIIADILKNAGMQAGKKASIFVFPANKVIEIRYNTG